jgi:hypothetical protein
VYEQHLSLAAALTVDQESGAATTGSRHRLLLAAGDRQPDAEADQRHAAAGG